MPAKRTTKTKKTARRRVTVGRQREEPQATVIPDIPVQPVQAVPFAQPVQPTQPPVITSPSQPMQPNQPTVNQPTQPQAQTVQPQQPSVQSAPLTFENPVTPTAEAEEAEIKIGTGDSSPAAQPGTDDPVKDDNQNQPHEKKNLLLPIIFIVLLGIAVLGGLFIFRQNFSNKQKEKVNVVSLSPTPEEPTPKTVDLSKYTISVLNGSEIDGAASNLKSDLEGAGFKVPSIGNADNSDYKETVIQAKENVDKDFLDKLTTTLEESFAVGKTEELDEDSETDIIVIIGSKTAE